ncbi:MAG: hypothetical protein H7247_03530 [Polaromonas sp.]|nr:hypothetical protein [Gemmatimonadaceae bacterium]
MRRRLLLALFGILGVTTPWATVSAQTAPRAFSLFLDCSDFYCEPDFYRTDIAFVDHVRDRTAADVHVLITNQSTGGGGRTYTLAFYGQRKFAGISDTLTAELAQGATEDEQRKALSRTIKLGLARYVARTPAGANATLSLAGAPADAPKSAAARDPWNAWVFRLGAHGNGSRERNFTNNRLNGSVSANRITTQWKTSLRVDENYNDQAFTIDGKKVTSVTRNFSGSALQVKSLGEHWSAGLRAGASSSTYLNQHLAASVAPAVEFDVYPYSESTRRQLRLQYSAGMQHYLYNDTTVYFKKKESRPFQSLTVLFEQKQKWGSLEGQVDGYHFLDDLSKSRLNYSLGADVRIIKGLSVNFYGNYSVLHDQIYLPKGSLSREDVLLRQSQLATTYRAFFYGGISYTFGSVFNNIVNPRFGGGGNNNF